MKILIACEFSGVVRDAFRRRGHEAWSCDLEDLEPEGEYYKYHLFGDARTFLNFQNWDLLIAHPPCTYLCNSGVRWLWNKDGSRNQERWIALEEGAKLYGDFWAASVPRICIENPIMHIYAHAILLARFDDLPKPHFIQPWQFGHGETKATGLRLKNLPKLQPTKIVKERYGLVHYTLPGPDRGKERSRTLPGIAEAMASQWGALNEPSS